MNARHATGLPHEIDLVANWEHLHVQIRLTSDVAVVVKEACEGAGSHTPQRQPGFGCTEPHRSPLLAHQTDPFAEQLFVAVAPDLRRTAAWCASAAPAQQTSLHHMMSRSGTATMQTCNVTT